MIAASNEGVLCACARFRSEEKVGPERTQRRGV
jgi:hypothetical protein